MTWVNQRPWWNDLFDHARAEQERKERELLKQHQIDSLQYIKEMLRQHRQKPTVPRVTLRDTYEKARRASSPEWNGSEVIQANWIAVAELHWSGFCMTWVSVAWAMLVGREQS